MFLAALFTIAKSWKKPKCPSNRWMDTGSMVHLSNEILLNHWQEWNYAIWSNMDGPRDNRTKWRKSERERQIPYDINYMCNLKYDTSEFIYETDS